MIKDKILNVYWEQILVGYYEQQDDKNFFSYAPSYLERNDAKAISIALPLQIEKFNAKTTHNFFAGILPEEQQRRTIARNLGITAGNDYSLLEKIGGECAGAISFFPGGIFPAQIKPEYKELTNHSLIDILLELPKRPLLAGEYEVRMSLAGVQDKLALAVRDDVFFLPLNAAPTTHIIKPEIIGYDFSTVTNEAFCLKLAKAIGLPVAECKICISDNIKFLLVKRYDREIVDLENFEIKRLHQEDFCQALNTPPESKYQNEGGPGLQQCLSLVRNVVTNKIRGIKSILDVIIYNYIIGNCDAHGKNFSLLYKDDTVELAPAYDLLCTGLYSQLSKKMAMKIGSEYNIEKVTVDDFLDFAQSAGLNKQLVLERVVELASKVAASIDDSINLKDSELVANYIAKRARKIIKSFNNR